MAEHRDAEFTDFVADHGRQLLRTACLVTGDPHLGEDLLQTALAKAYGSWTKVRQADHPAAYVRRLMINAHLSWMRRLTNTERVLETFPDVGSGDHQTAHAETDEIGDLVAKASFSRPDRRCRRSGAKKGPPAHPPEPAYPCCLPALGRFTG